MMLPLADDCPQSQNAHKPTAAQASQSRLEEQKTRWGKMGVKMVITVDIAQRLEASAIREARLSSMMCLGQFQQPRLADLFNAGAFRYGRSSRIDSVDPRD